MAGTNFKVKNGLEITSGTLVVSNGAGTNGQVLQSTGTGVEWGTASSGSGTVTSVAATVPSLLSISGSPITTSGTLAITYSGTALPVANGGTGLTTLTAGYIPYGAGTSALGSSANFFWDSTNSRLGIGTSSPGDKLHVEGNIYLGTTSRTIYQGGSSNLTLQVNTGQMVFARSNGSSESMRIDASGRLGIDTTTPSQKLDVHGGIKISGSATLGASAGTVGALLDYQYPTTRLFIGDGSGWDFRISTRASSVTTDRITFLDTGNIGIGTASPAYKLDVNGTLNASGAITQAGSQVLTAGNYTTYVNNGTLTLAVSGTGLTGSASFTANQSGNSTFTVTSNATNANTASTIVARDASGNFSAGTITANLTGNASGSAGSLANALTISSPLTGTSFNGSAAVSIGIPVATTSVNGYLSSTDWTTFNNKGSGTVTSVTGTSPVVSSGGTTPAISMPAATTSVSGYLTSTDWTTFNNKTSNTGTVTSVTGGTYLTGGTITTTGTLAVDATSANTASKVVARDGSGNFSAGTITATLSGNASTATSATSATTATTATNLSGGSVAATTGTFSGTVTIKSGSALGKLTVQTGGSDPVSPAAGDMVWYY